MMETVSTVTRQICFPKRTAFQVDNSNPKRTAAPSGQGNPQVDNLPHKKTLTPKRTGKEKENDNIHNENS